jgi:L-threonylcarbamoyladenylate synthase
MEARETRQTDRLQATLTGIARAAELLRAGRLVAFPTETVYGLGANAFVAEAVEGIFRAKRRPHWDPLIVHIASIDMLAEVALAGQDALALMEKFWPGPLTLLLPRGSRIGDSVTAGRPMVGVRMPQHPVALELIRQAGVPIAAPSANRFGHTSPTTAAHVLADLDGRIDAVLDGGATEVGLESTVIGIEGRLSDIVIYRPGAIDAEMLESVSGAGSVRFFEAKDTRDAEPESLPSPGVGLRHYAPNARLLLVDRDFDRATNFVELTLVNPIDEAQTDGAKVGVMLPNEWNRGSADVVFRWGPWHQPEILAQRLFAGLRELDERGATVIVCPLPQNRHRLGEALRDRLRKAAMPKG